jgi:hypothetical protein
MPWGICHPQLGAFRLRNLKLWAGLPDCAARTLDIRLQRRDAVMPDKQLALPILERAKEAYKKALRDLSQIPSSSPDFNSANATLKAATIRYQAVLDMHVTRLRRPLE